MTKGGKPPYTSTNIQHVTKQRISTRRFSNARSRLKRNQNNRDVEFRTADVIGILASPTTDTTHIMEAYKIIQPSSENMPKQWVSLGVPRLVRKMSNPQLFHFDEDGAHIFISTLSDVDKIQLAKSASDKYKTKVEPFQFVPLIHLLERFTAKIQFTNADNTEEHVVFGQVGNLLQSPLRMNFQISRRSDSYKSLEEAVKRNRSFAIQFEAASRGERSKINKLSILGSQVEDLAVTEKLFGDAKLNPRDAVFVSRDQLQFFSAAVAKSLQIIEEYDIAEEKFNEEFFNRVLQMVTEHSFQQVSFKEAIRSLSTFALDFKEDLKADQIQRDLGSILSIDTVGNKSYIKAHRDNLEKLKKKYTVDNSYSANVHAFDLFTADADVKIATDSYHSWLDHNKSLNEQLSDINSNRKSDRRWRIEGNRVVPKSLKVAKIQRSKFSTNFKLERIATRRDDQSFVQRFTLYTADVAQNQATLDELVARLHENINNTMKVYLDTLNNYVNKLNSSISAANINANEIKVSVAKEMEDLRNKINTNHQNSLQQQKNVQDLTGAVDQLKQRQIRYECTTTSRKGGIATCAGNGLLRHILGHYLGHFNIVEWICCEIKYY